MSRLLEAGFGHPAPQLAEQLGSGQERTLLVELSDSPVGTLRLTRRVTNAGVSGFVVDAAWRGRGIGRDVLRRVCLSSARRAHSGSDWKWPWTTTGLYTSIGFTEVTTEHYYALPVI